LLSLAKLYSVPAAWSSLARESCTTTVCHWALSSEQWQTSSGATV